MPDVRSDRYNRLIASIPDTRRGANPAMELLSEIWDKTTDALTAVSEGVSDGLIRLFGNSNERQIRRMRPIVARINELEPAMQALSDDAAAGQDGRVPPAAGRRARRSTTSCPRRSPPAARRAAASSRCGTTTSSSWAAWSCTAATSPRWSPAKARRSSPPWPPISTRSTGKGVHVVTVNDYLARRDAEWMSPLYNGLGMTVGAIQSDMDSRRAPGRSTSCDITYGTNNEFGFDYLRDNMKPTREMQAQGPAQLRDHRRGRQHPHRRGPDAAHHLRARRSTTSASTPRPTGSPGCSRRTSTSRSRRRSGPATSTMRASARPSGSPGSRASTRPATWSGRT